MPNSTPKSESIESPESHLFCWQSTLPPTTLGFVAKVIAGFALFTIVICLPFVLLIGLSILFSEPSTTAHHNSTGDDLSTLEIWLMALLPPAFIGLTMGYICLQSDIRNFCFDTKNKVLRYTEDWPYRKSRETEVPFEAIILIQPSLPNTYTTFGNLDVIWDEKKKTSKFLHLGHSLPLHELELLATTLQVHLGDRVKPTIRIDD